MSNTTAIEEHQRGHLTSVMIQRGTSLSLIRFFTTVYPSMVDGAQLNCKEMADIYGEKSGFPTYTPQAAGYHVKRLTKLGYLSRVHYRAWELNNNFTALVRE